GLDTTYHPFAGRPTWDALADLSLDEKVARLRTPEVRERILAEGGERLSLLATMGDRIWPFGEVVDYEPPVEESLTAVAERERRTPAEVLYDWQLRHDGRQMFMVPVLNYASADFEPLREMLQHPNS